MRKGGKCYKDSLIKTSIPEQIHFGHSIGILNLGELKLNLEINIVNINKKGLVIRTYYPLEIGDIISFNNGVGPVEGIVKWSNKDIDDKYSVGIHFILSMQSCYVADRL